MKGSTAIGYVSSASSEARLDSANRRYGTAPGRNCVTQACTSGPVVDSMKYGRPTQAIKVAAMARPGSVAASDADAGPGRMGSAAIAATSSTTCTRLCHTGRSNDTEAWAYR
jgi:hypothetical protein